MDEGDAEKGPKRNPTKKEVLEIIALFAENAELVREMSDEQGLYLLEVRVEGPEPNKATQYEYMRQGRHGNNNEASETAIHLVYYERDDTTGGEEGVGGYKLAVYDYEREKWVILQEKT